MTQNKSQICHRIPGAECLGVVLLTRDMSWSILSSRALTALAVLESGRNSHWQWQLFVGTRLQVFADGFACILVELVGADIAVLTARSIVTFTRNRAAIILTIRSGSR